MRVSSFSPRRGSPRSNSGAWAGQPVLFLNFIFLCKHVILGRLVDSVEGWSRSQRNIHDVATHGTSWRKVRGHPCDRATYQPGEQEKAYSQATACLFLLSSSLQWLSTMLELSILPAWCPPHSPVSLPFLHPTETSKPMHIQMTPKDDAICSKNHMQTVTNLSQSPEAPSW